MNELKKKAAQAIVNVFETGRVLGDYGRVTVMKGDTGHLTYGRSQTTLASGNLYLLIQAYCEAEGASLAGRLKGWLDRLRLRDVRLDGDLAFHRLLRDAGLDPVMREVQDRFFDRVYWEPSQTAAARNGIETELGRAVVYDSCVHGSWGRIREQVQSRIGAVAGAGEQTWISTYVQERRRWLATHSNELLRRTVYRMDSFGRMIEDGNWALDLPLRVRGVVIDEEALAGEPVFVAVSAEMDGDRVLCLRRPHMKGEDVRAVQRALKSAGWPIKVDGDYGTKTDGAVREFQEKRRLKADGCVGSVTRSALGL